VFDLRQFISGHLPLGDHISDTAVTSLDGGVMAVFEIDGVSPDTADDADINNWFAQLHTSYKNIHADDIELRVYRCRGEVDCPIYECERPPFARDLERAYREKLARTSLYLNTVYLLIHIHPPNTVQTATRFFSESYSDPRTGIEDRLFRLDEICGLLQSQLAKFGIRRLSYATRGQMLFDEMAEALAFAATGKWRPVPATTGKIGPSIFSEDISFKSWRMIRLIGAGEPYCATMFAFKNYPAVTWPGMFADFMVSPYRSTTIHSFRFLSNARAEAVVGRKHQKMLIGRDKAADQADELKQASADLLGRRCVLGEHSMLLLVFAENKRTLNRTAEACWRDLAACGLTGIRFNMSLRAAYLSIFPGGSKWRPRPGYISSENFTAFEPAYNWPRGKDTGWWGPPIAIFRTRAGNPFRFHYHVQDVGNFLITGMTGAGKTSLAGFLIAMTAGRARIAVLDFKRGWQKLIIALDGDYAVLGGGEPHCSPLKALTNVPANIEFLTELLRSCIGKLTEEENRRLALGLSIIMELPPAQRSLKELRAFFDDDPEGAGTRLEPWIWGNELGWVIDAPRDSVSLNNIGGWDITRLMDNPRARGPILAYISYRIGLELDGRPFMLIGDEFWRILGEEAIAALLVERNLRTIRSKGGIIGFITQSAGDIANSGISRILAEMCPTQIHGANPRGRYEDYKILGLTEGQWDALQSLQLGQGQYLLVQNGEGLVIQLPLHGLEQLHTLAAQEEDLENNVIEFKEAAE
jgi:type IV secretion system protein VirB4